MARKIPTFEEHAAKFQLNDEEQELLREIESGEWGVGSDAIQRIEVFQADMRETLKNLRGTRKAISLRLPESDIDGLKKIAEQRGVRYQTLVCDVLHKYVAGESVTPAVVAGVLTDQKARYNTKKK